MNWGWGRFEGHAQVFESGTFPGRCYSWNRTQKSFCCLVVLGAAVLVSQMVKNPPARQETWVWRSLGGGHGGLLQYSCLENPLGQRCLGPWGRKELDMTELLSTRWLDDLGYRWWAVFGNNGLQWIVMCMGLKISPWRYRKEKPIVSLQHRYSNFKPWKGKH